MAKARVATFNVENLFVRWNFREGVDPSEANKRGWTVDETLFHEQSVDDKALTGMAIRELEADVLALQEVEDVDTLKHFRSVFLGGRSAYPFVAGVDGNDPRKIDVAVLSKLPIVRIRSNQHLMDPESKTVTLFSRDCLEVDVAVGDAVLTLFVNHFKSMVGGREKSRGRRARQASAVVEITKARFDDPAEAPFAILGDLNDYVEADEEDESGLAPLIGWDAVENVVERLPEEERWTHYWKRGDEYRQLDYILPSKALAEANAGAPEIMRKGAPLRADRYEGERFAGVGEDDPKASDHCPVLMEIEV